MLNWFKKKKKVVQENLKVNIIKAKLMNKEELLKQIKMDKEIQELLYLEQQKQEVEKVSEFLRSDKFIIEFNNHAKELLRHNYLCLRINDIFNFIKTKDKDTLTAIKDMVNNVIPSAFEAKIEFYQNSNNYDLELWVKKEARQ